MSATPQLANHHDGPRLLPRPAPRHNALTYWHVLSLDAPSVAALWTLFIARACHLRLPWQSPAAMFVAVWMLYVADRLLDARSLAEPLEERHRFHHRHAKSFLAGICGAALLLAFLLDRLPAAALHLYVLLSALLAAWLLLVHARPHPALHRLPKELAVGIFFPAATFIPTIAHDPALRLELLPFAFDFAALCTLNCLWVYRWEHSDTRQAHPSTRLALGRISALSIAVCVFSVALAIQSEPWAIAVACALAAAALLLLDRARGSLRRIELRALADAVLLTPLLMLPFLR